MTRTGRAAVYDAPNTPFVIRDYPVRDVEPDEALVRVTMATICRSDIHSYLGHRPNPCPGILGHEIVGVIDQLGEKIIHDMRGDPLTNGDRVTWTEFFHHGPSYYRDVHDMPQKSTGLRKYGHDLVADDPHFLGGLVNPQSTFMLDGNEILRNWINIKGVHNYHPRHLLQALDFVMSHRDRFPFAEIVDSRFSLDQLDEAFARAADHSVLRAAIVP